MFSFHTLQGQTIELVRTHGWLLLLGGVVLAQWIALQGLLLHYHFFRKSLKRPRPDGIRMSLLEQTSAAHGEQIDTIYAKLAQIRKDLATMPLAETPKKAKSSDSISIETSLISMGEIQLKRRLQELKASAV